VRAINSIQVSFTVNDTQSVNNAFATDRPLLINTLRNSALTPRRQLISHSTLASTYTSSNPASSTNNGSSARIGVVSGGTLEFFSGGMSELIGYTVTLTGLRLNKVNSYLAIKYGLTLSTGTDSYSTDRGGNYISSDT